MTLNQADTRLSAALDTMAKHRFSLVACARWEETQIQEWVEYHKSIGFDHIYLYSNDDDPLPLFRAIAPYAYGADPFITFRHWPHVGEQVEIYLHFLDTFKDETEWFSFLDIDEFFVLKRVATIAEFMREHETQVDCLYFNWLIYGNCGKLRRDDGPTLTSYVRRASRVDAHTKMLCRSAAIDAAAIRQNAGRAAFWHFLDHFDLPGVRCRDVLQGPMDGYSANFPASTEAFLQRPGYSEALINRAYIAHFQFKSEEDHLRRWRRGGFSNGEQWRALYESGAHTSLQAANNAVYDVYLAAYWHRYTAPALRFGLQPPFGSPPHPNVALHKPTLQSSVLEAPAGEAAGLIATGGGNNGVRNGVYGFHTQFQMQPWWVVDLLGLHRLNEIHIYNRRDRPELAARANELEVMLSADGNHWTTLFSRSDTDPFGLDGTPLVVKASPALPYRFVQVRLRGNGYLHLQEIEVYGHPL
ncbi:MAG TPA: glycosyltransferase family 2 protein [Rhodopila sp.]|nr:glycosyltransferase family 2 protein [Rhodopila sp.]